MDDMESLRHTKWEQIPCGVHPQVRRKQLYGELRRRLGEVFRKLAEQNEPDCASIRRAEKKLCGQYFWARGYWEATEGRDEAAIRDYIRQQEHEDRRLDQINLWR